MDGDDVLAVVAGGPLGLLLVYLLAILLRVGCHFTRVEIPAIGRAFFTAGATTVLSVVAGYLLLRTMVGLDLSRSHVVPLFLALMLTLLTNLVIAVGLYRLLLHLRFGQALTLWIWQVGLFALLALLLGCCVGLPGQVLG